jgi:superfamily II DNA/RNA helicase
VSIAAQVEALKAGVDILIATPGRLLDHLRQGALTLGTAPSGV